MQEDHDNERFIHFNCSEGSSLQLLSQFLLLFIIISRVVGFLLTWRFVATSLASLALLLIFSGMRTMTILSPRLWKEHRWIFKKHYISQFKFNPEALRKCLALCFLSDTTLANLFPQISHSKGSLSLSAPAISNYAM